MNDEERRSKILRYLVDGRNQTVDVPRRGAVNSNCYDLIAGICNRCTFRDGIAANRVDSILGVEGEPCWNLHLFFLKEIGICLVKNQTLFLRIKKAVWSSKQTQKWCLWVWIETWNWFVGLNRIQKVVCGFESHTESCLWVRIELKNNIFESNTEGVVCGFQSNSKTGFWGSISDLWFGRK